MSPRSRPARADGPPPRMPGADHSALPAALSANAAALLAYFERRLAQHEDAADALGETMLQAWRRVDQLPADPVEARMWLFGIASNVRSNQWRSSRRRSALTERLATALATATPQTGDADFEDVGLRDVIHRLAPEQRELVTLVHWDGLTLAQAAQVLGVNPSTARGRYAAARRSLREALAPESADR